MCALPIVARSHGHVDVDGLLGLVHRSPSVGGATRCRIRHLRSYVQQGGTRHTTFPFGAGMDRRRHELCPLTEVELIRLNLFATLDTAMQDGPERSEETRLNSSH